MARTSMVVLVLGLLMALAAAVRQDTEYFANVDQNASDHYEMCCCPKDSEVAMKSYRAMCFWNLPKKDDDAPRSRLLMFLSREKADARKHLEIKNFAGVYELDLDALKYSKKRENWPSESQLVCDADPDAPLPRLSKCLTDDRKRFMKETLAVETDNAILKLAEQEATNKPYYCKRYASRCRMQFDERYNDFCYEFACNDFNAPCPTPGVEMTPSEVRQKKQAMETYMVSYLERLNSYYEEYQPSTCLTNEGVAKLKSLFSIKQVPGRLQRGLGQWVCPEDQGLAECRRPNSCSWSAKLNRLPKGKCIVPDEEKKDKPEAVNEAIAEAILNGDPGLPRRGAVYSKDGEIPLEVQ